MATIQLSFSEPHPGQQAVINEAKRFNVLQCGRRWGKTNFGVLQACVTAVEGAPVGWMAPTYKYLAEAWREINAALRPLQPVVNVQERRIELPTRGVLDFWSLDQDDPGRGRKYKRIIVDEAGLVKNLQAVWTEALRPTLVDLKGDAWFLGTPKGHNYFQRLYSKGQSGSPEWRSWRRPTSDNPFIDKAEIESAKQDMPPSAFAQEHLGIPADDGGNPFGLTAIAECLGALSSDPPVIIGVDLAKSQDWTVVCGLDGQGRVCVLERWQSDWGQTISKLKQMIGNVPALLDATGVGDPIVEELQRDMINVEGFKFTSPSKQQLMVGLATAIQSKVITFPDGWLRGELDAFEYETKPGGRVVYSAPSGMSDDGVCALALANHRWVEHTYHRCEFSTEGFYGVSLN